jgi:hypothetical protein
MLDKWVPGIKGLKAVIIVANQHVMISHQHVEAISTTKQEAKWKQSGSKVDARWKQKHGTC